ncbi:Hypp8335 [Branchiostoma lanceolatum]|uniref:Hypp8335 protein n=1 Tax=Branchiostoma lanceolatum TaxID=7740 RepID=A0A8J9Z7B9_BRALA|nr:Hypp8335 [Branchiostoma lanceolatum]
MLNGVCGHAIRDFVVSPNPPGTIGDNAKPDQPVVWVLSENLQLGEDGEEVPTPDRYLWELKTVPPHVVDFDSVGPQDRTGIVLRNLLLALKAYLQPHINWPAGVVVLQYELKRYAAPGDDFLSELNDCLPEEAEVLVRFAMKEGLLKEASVKKWSNDKKVRKALQQLPKLFKGSGAPPVPLNEMLIVILKEVCEWKFFTRSQASGETFDEYLIELRTSAAECGFGAIKDSLIRDRILCGIPDGKV